MSVCFDSETPMLSSHWGVMQRGVCFSTCKWN